MREYWVDHAGKRWLVSTTRTRLKFKLPCHAALRAYVFHRDGFTCRRCGAKAVRVPQVYTGRYALQTNTFTGEKYKTNDVLVVDHIKTQAAGGSHHPDNLQALCETCNKRKIPEDREAIARSQNHGG